MLMPVDKHQAATNWDWKKILKLRDLEEINLLKLNLTEITKTKAKEPERLI